ncbi:ABC transporter permease [Saccharopolyspora taberi]|uniref:Multidrug efflux ABC transporter permease n=1 Tax=Saccharopolyspora taberi TaxID=60895 RepID=A0ABN3V262_9PSEU
MNSFAGTGEMLRLAVRRDRVRGTAWVLFLLLLVVGVAAQYAGLFPDDRARLDFAAEVRANSALNAFTGLLHGTGLGNLVMWKIGDIAFTLIALMAVLTVVRHTRAEEETGRSELVGAGVVGRFAPLTAALVHTCGLSLAAGVLSAAGLIAYGLEADGSITFGLALVMPGIFFAAVAALAAQLTERARTANAIACTVLGAGYLIRFVADGAGLGGLRWLSPSGWSHLAVPYGGNRVWVLAVPVLLSALVATAAYRLADRRDLGAGVLSARTGPAAAGRGLRGPVGLAWRLHRTQLLGWIAGFTAFSAATAGVATGMPEVAERSGQYVQEFFRRYTVAPGVGIADTFIWLILLSLGYLAALYPMLAALRLRTEETSGRAEATLATSVGRTRWAVSHLVFAACGSVLLPAASGLAAGGVHAAATGDPAQLPRVLAAALVQVPAVWLVGAVAVIAFGAVPRLAVAIAWVVFMLVMVLGEVIGPILGIDYWLANLVIPFHHVPKLLTGGTFSATPLLVMTALAVALTAAGLAALRRRDLSS